jgi:hypothetical protein
MFGWEVGHGVRFARAQGDAEDTQEHCNATLAASQMLSDPLPSRDLPPKHTLRVDPKQNVDAVTCPFSD